MKFTPYQRKIADELEMIRALMVRFPGGVSAPDILDEAGLSMELHTLQRRLRTLVESGLLLSSGSRRTTKYFPVPGLQPSTVLEVQESNESYLALHPIPLTSNSREIIASINRPLSQRKPVGYNRDFLDGYRPNIDFYLSEAERKQLDLLTTTPGVEVQPAGTYFKNILQRLLIDLSWNSSRLEGNTYSLLDTERLLSQGLMAPNKSAAEAQMILNHKDAIEFLVSGVNEVGFDRYTLQNLHAILANNLLPDPAAPGRLRSFAVGIRQSAYTPTAIPQLIEEMFEIMLTKVAAIHHPHEQALFLMIHLPYLQAFDDVNKRLSRLAANISLNKHNRIPISFVGVPEDLYIKGLLGVYELNRPELLKDIFIWACSRSADRYASVRQTIGEPDPFRIRYRQKLQALVTEIISKGLSHKEATAFIDAASQVVAKADQAGFRELVETELLSLHEGNFARYRVSPTEFRKWRQGWYN